MRYQILLLIGLFCYPPLAFSAPLLQSSPSLTVFIDPATNTFSAKPARKPSPRNILSTEATTEPQVIDSPVAGGGKMVRIHGLLDSDFVIHKTIHGWQTQCHLNDTH